MKITYVVRDDGGCGYYRLVLPMTRLVKAGYEVKSITAGMPADAILKQLDSQIVVIPRPCDEQMLLIMQTLQKYGIKVVIDNDDDFFTINPLSTHYGDFGCEEVTVENEDGTRLEVWKDGHNINLERNRKVREIIKEAVSTADLMTVTQPVLAEAYAPYAKKITCLPNCVDMEKWQRLPLQRRDDVRLYWSGGASHYEDWLLIGEALDIVMQKYPHVNLHIMGTLFRGPLKRINPARISVHPWENIHAYPYRTAINDADISIIPLDDNAFNRGKSNIKWVEQSALSVPSVCSAVTPYQEANNGVNGLFVNNDTKSWVAAISELVEDSILRAKVGQEAWDTVYRDFNIDRQYKRWIQAYEEIL